MFRLRPLPHRIIPFILSGVSGAHVIVRLWRASRQPASVVPLPTFLLQHADVLLVVCGGPIILVRVLRAQIRAQRQGQPAEPSSVLVRIAIHDLRQLFTALLLALDLIDRYLRAGRLGDVERLVGRIRTILRQGIATINLLEANYLEPSDSIML